MFLIIDLNQIFYLIVFGFGLVLLFLFFSSIHFQNLRKRLNGYKPIEEDKVSQMIHSEPFALNSYMILDIEGFIIGLNSRAKKMFGWDESEVKGKRMDKIILPEFMDQFTDYKINHPTREYESTIEVEGINKAGEKLYLDILIGKWEADLEWYYTVVIRDISHRKRNEQALHKAQETINALRSLYHEGEKIGNVAFWQLDSQTGNITNSPNFGNLFGVKGMDFHVDSIIKRVVAEDRIKVADTMKAAKDEKRGYDMTYRMNGLDGYVNTIQSTAMAVKNKKGELTHFIGMARLVKKEKPQWR